MENAPSAAIISPDVLAEQLANLLQVRELSQDEIGLIYCYKHEVSLNSTLKSAGFASIEEFIADRKELMLVNGNVRSALRRNPQPYSVAKELQIILRAHGGQLDIATLCSKFVQKFHVTISSIVHMKPMEFLSNEPEFFCQGRGLIKLNVRPLPKTRVPECSLLESLPHTDDTAYADLHYKIASPSVDSHIKHVARHIAQVVTDHLFIDIKEVVFGGSAAKGTATVDNVDASVVFFVDGLPRTDFSCWLPRLVKCVGAMLIDWVATGSSNLPLSDIECNETSVNMKVDGVIAFQVGFATAFDSYASAIQCLGEQGQEQRAYFMPTLAKEKVMFIARQPANTKMTIRLLKWWREQQEWSRDICRPSDEILELVAVYVWQKSPKDQRRAVAKCMTLMACFDHLRVVWTNFYGKEDIWEPLLQQRPLLMDPVSPFNNVADPHIFDPQQLQKFARDTHFFW